MVIQRRKEACDKEKRFTVLPVTHQQVTDVTHILHHQNDKQMDTILRNAKFQFSTRLKDRLVFLISLVCISLFVYTAYSKIIDHHRFFKGLSKVAVIGGSALYISWLVPAAEISISVLLSIPNTYRWGLYGFTCLMILFTGYILSIVLWAKRLPCHCGGVIEKLSWTQHIWFNLAFIALAVFALWLSKLKTSFKN